MFWFCVWFKNDDMTPPFGVLALTPTEVIPVVLVHLLVNELWSLLVFSNEVVFYEVWFLVAEVCAVWYPEWWVTGIEIPEDGFECFTELAPEKDPIVRVVARADRS
jgi:hypothetical protein